MEQVEEMKRRALIRRKRAMQRRMLLFYHSIYLVLITAILLYTASIMPHIISGIRNDPQVVIDVSKDLEGGTIPLFLQWDERWGTQKYGADSMAVTGCGPTCLSMVRCGLSGDPTWNPLQVAHLAEKEGFYIKGSGSSWTLMSEGAEMIGLTVHEIIYDEEHILTALRSGIPIIAVMGPGDFTSSGHFIVLTGVDEDGYITVCDPNSRDNSTRHWEAQKLISQIKNLWGYSYSK